MRRATLTRALVGCTLAAGAALPAAAQAERYETGLEGPSFAPGLVQGQDGWSNGAPVLDAGIVSLGDGLGSGSQAFRMSNAFVTAGFNQVRTQRLTEAAGEAEADGPEGPRHPRFEASFDFGSFDATLQKGLSLHVSPDNGAGRRMTAVRISDVDGGLAIEGLDPVDNGPGKAVDWGAPYTPIATGISRDASHTLRFAMELPDGPSNDVVRIYLDDELIHTAVSWEQYYRNDPEQAPFGNELPVVNSLQFMALTAWDKPQPLLINKGLLFDELSLESSTPAPPADSDPPKQPEAPNPPAPPAPPVVDPPAEKKDATPPTLHVGGSTSKKATIEQGGYMERRMVALPALRCSERCTVRASGTLSLRVGGKPVKLKVVRQTLASGKRAQIKLALSPKVRKALRAALKDGKTIKATVVLQVRDRAGNVRNVRRTIRLKG